MSKKSHYRVTCISKEMIHTMTSINHETISETFKEVVSGKSKNYEVRSIEFEPVKDTTNSSVYTV